MVGILDLGHQNDPYYTGWQLCQLNSQPSSEWLELLTLDIRMNHIIQDGGCVSLVQRISLKFAVLALNGSDLDLKYRCL